VNCGADFSGALAGTIPKAGFTATFIVGVLIAISLVGGALEVCGGASSKSIASFLFEAVAKTVVLSTRFRRFSALAVTWIWPLVNSTP
jgi:hypothetical protein